MSDANSDFYGQINYSPIWLLIGLLLLVFAVGIVVGIFYVTRRKKIKTISTLKIKPPKVVDMNALCAKYIKMIDEAEESFKKRQIKASKCHQRISFAVRLFYFEAHGFHADIMTLTDLKKSKYDKLTKLVGDFYPNEFDTLEKGSVADAAERARAIIREQAHA
jgi:hypothetical protein